MFKGIETVTYFVEDVRAAGAWYAKVLGVEPNYDTEYYVGFTVGGDELGLHPAEGKLAKGEPRQAAYWSVDDIQEAVAHLTKSGGKLVKPVQDVGGGVQVASVEDPFGNYFGIIQNPKSPNRKR